MDSSVGFVVALVWILISAFSYGYHISALNGVQDVITCRSSRSRADHLDSSYLVPCIAMSDNLFGLLTASYTIGGLFGSVYASELADSKGRKNTILIASIFIGSGSALMSFSNSFLIMLIGRTIIGIGCGISTVLVPIYISEISPPNIRGSIGVMNQLAIVIGIFSSQSSSLPFSEPYAWRWIFVISAALSIIQILSSPFMVESPKWLTEKNSGSKSKPLSHLADDEDRQLEQGHQSDSEENVADHSNLKQASHDPERQNLLNLPVDQPPIINPSRVVHAPSASITRSKQPLSVAGLINQSKIDPALAQGLKVVLITQIAQQLSGINAVLYYSTSIMKSVLPAQAIYISLFITLINVIMTFPAIFLIDKIGRKTLLLISLSSMGLSSLILGFSINFEIGQLSSLAIVGFVASFSLGLGPIPFVILSEVVPDYAVSSAGSLGLAVNWASSFLVGLVFLPLRNFLTGPDGDGDGNVFFIFTLLNAVSFCLVYKNNFHYPQS